MLIDNTSRSSNLFRAIDPAAAEWTPEVEFMAAILYTLQGANWQRGGGKGPKPKLIEAPSGKNRAGGGAYASHVPNQQTRNADDIPGQNESGPIPTAVLPQDEMAKWLGWA